MNIVLHHLGVVAADPDRTIDFYARLFDATTARMAGHTVVAAGSVRIAVVPRRDTDPPTYAWGSHVAIQVSIEARESLLARLGALGASYEDVGGRLYTRDPDGLTIEVLFG
ncbi:MAG: VOC family protein [Myxococcota bacterium]